MRLQTFTATLLSATLAPARIIGLSSPSTLAPGTPFTFNLTTENYIQSDSDVAVAWGFQIPTESNPTGFPYTLGFFTNSSYLGESKSNTLQDVTVDATVPAGLDIWAGQNVVFNIAVMSLYGVSRGPVTQGWNVTVQVGEQTGGEYVESQGLGWSENGSC